MARKTVSRLTGKNHTPTLCRELAKGLGGSSDYMSKKTMGRLRQERQRRDSYVKILEKGHSRHCEWLVQRPQDGCIVF